MTSPGGDNIIMNVVKYTISLILESMALINPANIASTFKDMKPMPKGFLRLYLFIVAVPLFIGYFLYFDLFQPQTWSFDNSLKVALRYYITAALIPMVMGYLLYLFDSRLVKANITQDEALTLFTYALTPGLISGIFKTSNFTLLLHIVGMMYSVYLVYAGLETRYGQEKSVLLPFMFVMLSAMFCTLAILGILTIALGISPYYW